MFCSQHKSQPSFILGGSVSPLPRATSPTPAFTESVRRHQFKSQFAKQLFTDGSQWSRASLDKLRKENVNLKQKVEICRSNKNKFEFLQNEVEVLRERVGKISAEISLQDISTQQLLTSVHTISRQLSLYTSVGLRRSKSCFHVPPTEVPAVKKRSRSVAGDLGQQRRPRRTEDSQAGKETSGQTVRTSSARALRRVKTFLKPFRKTYKLERNSYLDTPEVKVLQCRLDLSPLEY